MTDNKLELIIRKCNVFDVDRLKGGDIDPGEPRFDSVTGPDFADGQKIAVSVARSVIIAIGYPPSQIAPDLEDDQWMYWMHGFDRTVSVYGQDGSAKVTRNRDARV